MQGGRAHRQVVRTIRDDRVLERHLIDHKGRQMPEPSPQDGSEGSVRLDRSQR
jgi:hypothetical protein